MRQPIHMILMLLWPSVALAAPMGNAIRCPDGGIQPQVVVDCFAWESGNSGPWDDLTLYQYYMLRWCFSHFFLPAIIQPAQ